MPSEILNPVSDFVFKLIWGDQRNIDLLAGFLRTVAGLPEEEIAQMTVADPHLKRFWNRDKLGVVDVRVTTKTGRVISVEIQVQRDSKMRKRIVFYSKVWFNTPSQTAFVRSAPARTRKDYRRGIKPDGIISFLSNEPPFK
jgi:predicted transposase/invertase (TIGR01784 family)